MQRARALVILLLLLQTSLLVAVWTYGGWQFIQLVIDLRRYYLGESP